VGVTAQASDNKIHVFSIGSTDGSLTEVTNSPFSTVNTPLNLAIHPNGAWVYTFNQDSLLHEIQPMEGFTLSSATGALTEITGSPFLTLTANGGAIEPSGQFLIGLGVTVVGGFSESTSTPFNINSNTGALSVTLNSLGFPGIDAAAYAVTDGQ
jgi:hypothetical protein